MRTRNCKRCGQAFERTRRDPSIWCRTCRGELADAELTALVFRDRSGIFGLYEKVTDAFEAFRADSVDGTERLYLVKVIGHAGAVSQVEREDEHRDSDRRYDDSHFERSQERFA